MTHRQGASILVVGDNGLATRPLVSALIEQGHAVRCAHTAEEAVRLAAEPLDLIVLDGLPPNTHPAELCRRIRGQPGGTAATVLQIGVPEGWADAHIADQAGPEDLARRVRGLLAWRQARADPLGEAHLQLVLDLAPVAAAARDVRGLLVFVNQPWEALVGRSRQEALGRSLEDVLGETLAAPHRGHDGVLLTAGGVVEFEQEFPGPTGSRVCRWRKFPLLPPDGGPLGLWDLGIDVTEQRRARAAQCEAEALHRSLVETLPFGLFRKDLAGRYTFASDRFAREVGRAPSQIVGLTDAEFLPAGFAELGAEAACRALRTRKAVEVVGAIPGAPGGEKAERVLRLIQTPLPAAADGPVGVQGVCLDVTGERQTAEERGHYLASMRLGRQVQQHLYPSPRSELVRRAAAASLDLGGASYPAEAIGGDYFDYVALPDGALGVAVGDVSGHGVGPALLMAITRSYLRAVALREPDPGEVLRQVNLLLVNDLEGDRFITLLLAHLDPATRVLRHASAGHATGYVLDPEARIKHTLGSTDIPLGIVPDTRYSTGPPLTLETGDIVLILTDGIVEARDPAGSAFGLQRVLDLVRVYRRASSREIVDNLYHAVRAFSHNEPQYDDITASVLKVG